MRIRRIEVRSFRKLDHLVVEDLEDGLNVLVGDNEVGKSTLLDALRAGFFTRHRIGGRYADELQPYGQSVRPEVAIDFELGATRWSLRKAFCQKQEAELIGPGERLAGDAVEDRLATLLGFVPPGKGEPNEAEHHGVHGLLWVTQGKSHAPLQVGSHRDAIASALEGEVGQIMGGERGRSLLAKAEARRADHWDKRGKPRGAAAGLARSVTELRTAREEIVARLDDHRGKVDALAAKTETLARLAREDRLGRARGTLTRATEAVRAIDALSREAEGAAGRLGRAREDLERAQERAVARRGLIQRLEEAMAGSRRTEADLAEAGAALARQEERSTAAEALLRQKREARLGADERLRLLERAADRHATLTRLGEIERSLKQAVDADDRRRTLAATAATLGISPDDLAALDRLQAGVDRAGALLEAASVRMTFESDRRASLDGAPIDPRAPLTLSRDAVLDLEGFGRVVIRPGGGVAPLREAVEAATRDLGKALGRLGVGSVAEARERLRQRGEAEREAESFERMIEALAPDGVGALREATESLRAKLSLSDGSATLDEVPAHDGLEEARVEVGVAREEDVDAEASAAGLRALREEAGRRHAELKGHAAAAARRVEEVSAALAAERAAIADEALAAALGARLAAVDAAETANRAAEVALAAADPEAARLSLDVATRAVAAIETDIRGLDRDKRDLQVALAASGHDGLGERLAETEERLAAEEASLAAAEIEARAARLLHETLAVAQRETRDRWLGPVRERMEPYLRLIHPGGAIELDEATLGIARLVRDGSSERFDDLSVGAQEQVAVITRLAFADLLRASGRPAAIILDDALVNTDEKRLERMHLVLNKAAGSMQVLVLTCRERDFSQLGAPIRRI